MKESRMPLLRRSICYPPISTTEFNRPLTEGTDGLEYNQVRHFRKCSPNPSSEQFEIQIVCVVKSNRIN